MQAVGGRGNSQITSAITPPRRLAQLQALGQLPTVVIPPTQTRQWRALIACRQALVGRRVVAQNRIRATLVGQGLPALRGHSRPRSAAGSRGDDVEARPAVSRVAGLLQRLVRPRTHCWAYRRRSERLGVQSSTP